MTVRNTEIWTETSGNLTGSEDRPTLVLLHGLGANGSVWRELLSIVQKDWPGHWLNLDFRGHGRSGHAAPYSYAGHAADVAAMIGGRDRPVALIGHSMGGVVALTLATGWFGVKVDCALAFGVKIAWTPEETARMQKLATAPVRWFDTREEAVDRYLKISGLIGRVPAESERAALGICEEGGRYRLASDPRINGLVGPDVAQIYKAAESGSAKLRLAAGENDPMATIADMLPLDPDAVTIPEAGHNAHIERPERVWELLQSML